MEKTSTPKDTTAFNQACPALGTKWEDLTLLLPTGLMKHMQALPDITDYRVFLSPPATLARLIATYTPHLTKKPIIRVLSVGAETSDTIDSGKWITALTPIFLADPLQVSLTCVGPELSQKKTPIAQYLPGEHKKATFYAITLKEFLTHHSPKDYDIAVFFNPGFEANRKWLDDKSIAKLAAARIPLLATSYSIDDYATDKTVLQAYGYRVPDVKQENPYCYGSPGAGEACNNWGGIIWQIESRPPDPKTKPDKAKIKALQAATAYQRAMGQCEMSYLGQAITAQSQDGPLNCIPLIGNTFLLTDNQIGIYHNGTIEATGIRYKKGILPPYPQDASPMEKAIWAIEASLLAKTKNLTAGNRQSTGRHRIASMSPTTNDIINDPTIRITQETMPGKTLTHTMRHYSIPSEKYLTTGNCMRLLKRIAADSRLYETYVAVATGGKKALLVIKCDRMPNGKPMLVAASEDIYNKLIKRNLDIDVVTTETLMRYISHSIDKDIYPCMPITVVEVTGNSTDAGNRSRLQTGHQHLAAPVVMADTTSQGVKTICLLAVSEKQKNRLGNAPAPPQTTPLPQKHK